MVSALAPIPNVSFVALRVKTGKVAHHQRLTWVHVPSHGTCTCSRHMKKKNKKYATNIDDHTLVHLLDCAHAGWTGRVWIGT